MRNRFKTGDELEVLSPSAAFNSVLKAESITDEKGEDVTDAKLVQQKLLIKTDLPLHKGDILRAKQ